MVDVPEKVQPKVDSDKHSHIDTSRDKAELHPSTDADKDTASDGHPDITISKDAKVPTKPAAGGWKRGLPFWMILVALSFTSLLTALEATITSTALPSIIADLGGGDLYVWAANGYFLTM